MDAITIEKKDATANGWKVAVVVGQGGDTTRHTVTLEKSYWQKLTGGKTEPEELIRKSFEFLLQRESKRSILSSFDLPVIGRYFPEYEREIGKC